jgi:hypothetical protein
MLFIQTAKRLHQLKAAPDGVLNEHDLRRFKKTSDVFHGAVAWDQYCRNRTTLRDVPEDAQDHHDLLRRVAGPQATLHSLDAYWKRISEIKCTLNMLLIGQRPAAPAFDQAADTCGQIADYMMASQNARSCEADE